MDELVESNRGFMYLSLQSANRSILYPWIYEPNAINKNIKHQQIAKYAADRIHKSTGTRIKDEPIYFFGKGTSLSYAYKLGFPLSFVFDMSGMNRSGVDHKFFPPNGLIRELVEESWLGIRSLTEKAMELSCNYGTILRPTRKPTRKPKPKPTGKPTRKPTPKPKPKPTGKPTRKPTRKPTSKPNSKTDQKQLTQNVTLLRSSSEIYQIVPLLNSTILKQNK
ncbi:putative uncharacterized protein DDB_G0290521 isoform X1 [Drosophila ananassae]|uniref:putative uncharacterized protein DDB_G0290521 isoform X1 n=1 Tax=Drosophila ananassae TaxID=7217 RepID=UPI001D001493|nr:putative uncharacterized protein DDB_G0290521 isoform X1 [Drosophila ananassae]